MSTDPGLDGVAPAVNSAPSARPDLSVVIVSFNTADLLASCLASVLASGGLAGLEVIVVDNASADGSADMVAARFPAVRLVRNTANVGYAKANNQGLAMAAGRQVVLLNSDTLVPPDALAALVAFMDAHPEAGAASPRLLTAGGTPQAYAYGDNPTLRYLIKRRVLLALGRRFAHDWATEVLTATDWVSGACLIVRREVVDAVGGLDEALFLYFEDTDWCLRIREAGWKVYYVPNVSITHLGGQSLSRNPAAGASYYRSLEHFAHKHYGAVSRLLLRLLLRLSGAMKARAADEFP